MIPISALRFGAEEENAVLAVIRSGVIAQGPVVAEFERRFAELAGTKHAVALNNGTTTLIAALRILGLREGDEVITSPFTFVATLNAILDAGATPVFADIRAEDFNLDPTSVRSLVTDKTKVLMPVHLYGQMADMNPLVEIANEFGLQIVEDSAQSHGATYYGKPAGSYGLGSFSFYATKNLTTGEGGMVTTDNDDHAEKLRILRNQGMRQRYQYEIAGNNFRLTDLQAALVIPQLDSYQNTVTKRQRNARFLSKHLSGIEGLHLPQELPGRKHVWHQYTVRIDAGAAVSRNKFIEGLDAAGIGHGIYYPKLVFDYPPFRSHPSVKIPRVPVAAAVVEQVVSLPVHVYLSEGELLHIVDTVRTIMKPN